MCSRPYLFSAEHGNPDDDADMRAFTHLLIEKNSCRANEAEIPIPSSRNATNTALMIMIVVVVVVL